MGGVSFERLLPGATVTVRRAKASKADLVYPMTVVEDDGDHVVVRGPFSEPEPRDLGYIVFEPSDVFTEHLWRSRWFTIAEVRDGDGRRKGWYCDVARPVIIDGGTLVSVDLDLDLWLPPEGDALVLDEDEFDASGLAADDPAAAAQARSALLELGRAADDGFASLLGAD